MDYETGIRPISYIKTHAAQMLEQINETQSPIVITQNGHAKGVLVDARSYQEMVDAIGLLKLMAHSENDIEAGRTVSHADAIRRARGAISDE